MARVRKQKNLSGQLVNKAFRRGENPPPGRRTHSGIVREGMSDQDPTVEEGRDLFLDVRETRSW